MSTIAALPVTAPVRSARPRLELVRPGFVPRPAEAPAHRPAAPRPAVARPTPARAAAARPGPARPAAAVRPRVEARTRQHLTARGRAVVATFAFLAATTAAVGVGAWAGQAGAAGAEGPVTAVTVGAGETLWGIAAGAAAPGEDVRDVVDEMLALNGLSSAELRAGQQILVPAS
ncbi:LysM peptidoglycan-binding domain-containing protein [Georgenia wangjunii]|uniref:LysM peptidoglycan-binding domain-containing protein n=1 Tax=Georgenia wangjunii TaxID=3117730 RepID=UPI002F25FFAA